MESSWENCLLSEFPFPIVAPARCGPKGYSLATDDHARTAFYSHEKRIREDGRMLVPTNLTRVFEWTPSPSFGTLLRRPVVGGETKSCPTYKTTCLRAEFVMITHAYIIETLRTVTEEFRQFILRGGHKSTRTEPTTEIRAMGKRMYEIYLIAKNVLRPNVILCTVGRTFPACPELSVYTTDALLCVVLAFHTVIVSTAIEMLKRKKTKGKGFTDITYAQIYMFVSNMFYRAYTILNEKVWPFYTPGTTPRTVLQLYLMGNGHFFLAKSYMFAYRHESAAKPAPRAIIQLSLLRRAYYLLRLTSSKGSLLGFHEPSTNSCAFIVAQLAIMRNNWELSSEQDTKIETPEDFDSIERHVSSVICDKDARHVLKTHVDLYGQFFKSAPEYCTLSNACLFVGAPN